MPGSKARTMELGRAGAGSSDGLLMRSQDGPHRETNSLSLREIVAARSARVRGKAARNRQGPGALPGVERCFPSLRVVDFIGSSQAGWFAERFFPLTPALSPRRGRTVRCALANPERLDSSPRGMRSSLSLRERARVRGKAARNCQGPGALPGVERCFPSLRVVDFIGSSQAGWFAERFFPLTPALSPRRGRTVRCALANPERLDSSPRGMRSSLSLRERARVRGKAARNCQGPGALPGVERCFPSLRVVDFIGSSQAGWFAERFFPLTPALSPRRGRTVRCALANPERLDSSPRGMRSSLSLRERARVRGKAARNCQGPGALPGVERCFPSLRVVDFIGSSQAGWFAERF